MTPTNEHLEHFITQTLAESEGLSSRRIEVTASEGLVTLRGKVQSARRKLHAQEIAERHPDVTGVVNELVVEEGTLEGDIEIAAAVNRRLDADLRMANQAVRVDCLNGTVTLSGYVSSSLEKDAAADIALGVTGVRDINNLLIVNPDRVLANREHGDAIRAAIDGSIGLDIENLFVTIVDETARISGAVDEVWKKDEIEKIVRKFHILTVCNEIEVRPRR